SPAPCRGECVSDPARPRGAFVTARQRARDEGPADPEIARDLAQALPGRAQLPSAHCVDDRSRPTDVLAPSAGARLALDGPLDDQVAFELRQCADDRE